MVKVNRYVVTYSNSVEGDLDFYILGENEQQAELAFYHLVNDEVSSIESIDRYVKVNGELRLYDRNHNRKKNNNRRRRNRHDSNNRPYNGWNTNHYTPMNLAPFFSIF